MFRRTGMRICRTSALVGALLFMAGTGRAMAWQGPDLSLTRWESAWEWIASWFGQGATPALSGSAVSPGAHEKSSAGIDPNGQPASSSSLQSDSSSQIDPNGQH